MLHYNFLFELCLCGVSNGCTVRVWVRRGCSPALHRKSLGQVSTATCIKRCIHALGSAENKKNPTKPQKNKRSDVRKRKQWKFDFQNSVSSSFYFLCPTPYWISFRDRGKSLSNQPFKNFNSFCIWNLNCSLEFLLYIFLNHRQRVWLQTFFAICDQLCIFYLLFSIHSDKLQCKLLIVQQTTVSASKS